MKRLILLACILVAISSCAIKVVNTTFPGGYLKGYYRRKNLLCKEIYRDSMISCAIFYNKDNYHDSIILYHKDTTKSVQYFCCKDSLIKQSEFWPNGNLHYSINISKVDTIEKRTTGEYLSISIFQVYSGYMYEYYESGIKRAEGKVYRNDKRGVWIYYTEDGVVEKKDTIQ